MKSRPNTWMTISINGLPVQGTRNGRNFDVRIRNFIVFVVESREAIASVIMR
jgi:hypothetical protein